MRSKLAESENFIISSEYGKVLLIIKKINRKVIIGDFYGEPQTALISSDESFCVIAGCGMIIYYLHEPYEAYRANTSTNQWKELHTKFGEARWIEHVEYIDNSTIIYTIEDEDANIAGRYKLDINSLESTKYIKT